VVEPLSSRDLSLYKKGKLWKTYFQELLKKSMEEVNHPVMVVMVAMVEEVVAGVMEEEMGLEAKIQTKAK
jgi:hypothetical protein